MKLTPLVHPRQLFGIEVNAYAHTLASVVIWIGYLQWKLRNGMPLTDERPVLRSVPGVGHLVACHYVEDISDAVADAE